MFHGSVDGVHCAESVQICCTAITFGGIKNAISAVIKFLSALGAVVRFRHLEIRVRKNDVFGVSATVIFKRTWA